MLRARDEDYAGAVGKVMSKGGNVERAFRKNLSRGLKNAALTKMILDDYVPQTKV